MQRRRATLLAALLVLLTILGLSGIAIGAPGVQPPATAKWGTPPPPPPTVTPFPSPTPSPTPGGGTGWHLVGSPNVQGRSNLLSGLDGVSGSDIWAVGEHRTNNSSSINTLTMHWNGANWSIVSSPNPDPNRSRLLGVDAVSSTDAWAVGIAGGHSGLDWRGIILRWGGKEWSSVEVPRPAPTGTSELRAVSARSANDVWAVGVYASDATGFWEQPYTVHWDGSAWTNVPVPSFGTTAELNAVKAIAPDDVWAVGTVLGSNWRTLILHWDGASWSRVSSPNLGNFGNGLLGVGAAPGGEVWAVGSANNGASTLTLRWNGAAWTLVPSPNGSARPGINQNALHSVAAVSENNIWAVGVQAYSTIGAAGQPVYIGFALIERWNGSAWSEVPAPGLPTTTSEDGYLRAVIALGPGNVWAAGAYYESDLSIQAQRTLIMRNTQP